MDGVIPELSPLLKTKKEKKKKKKRKKERKKKKERRKEGSMALVQSNPAAEKRPRELL